MKYLYIFGASIVHGLGGSQGGWADKVKFSLHRDMYGEDAAGEVCAVYPLGVPGADTPALLDRFEHELIARGASPSHAQDTVIVLQTGTNDSKAIDTPDGFIYSAEDYGSCLSSIVNIAKKYAATTITVGLPPADERRASPKRNAITGGLSYFTNSRIELFEQTMQQVSKDQGTQHVPIFAAVPDDWLEHYVFTDGVHPDDKGYTWMAKQIEPVVRAALGDLL